MTRINKRANKRKSASLGAIITWITRMEISDGRRSFSSFQSSSIFSFCRSFRCILRRRPVNGHLPLSACSMLINVYCPNFLGHSVSNCKDSLHLSHNDHPKETESLLSKNISWLIFIVHERLNSEFHMKRYYKFELKCWNWVFQNRQFPIIF